MAKQSPKSLVSGVPPPKASRPLPSAAPNYGKPVEAKWLTPDLRDKMIVVLKDSRADGYVVPNQGDPFGGIDTPRKILPSKYKFATVLPTDQVGDVHWVYLAERESQEAYNYQIEFPYVDTAFPVVTREYVVLRTDTLVTDEPAAGTADPTFTTLILTDHKIGRLPEPLDSIFVSVSRKFEKIPGQWHYQTRVEVDGIVVTIQNRRNLNSAVTDAESLSGGIWKTIIRKPINSFIAEEVWESRAVPGNPVLLSKLDDMGNVISIVRTLKAVGSITPGELISSGVWMRTHREEVPWLYGQRISDLVEIEVVEAQPVPGNTVEAKTVNQQEKIVTTDETIKNKTLITPSVSESGGTITEVEKVPIPGSNLVAKEKDVTRQWLDEASFDVSIPEDIIPSEFRAFIPTIVVSHIVAGIATQPTLGAGEFRHVRRQLNALLYEERITTFDVTLPHTVVGKETTEEYGGGILRLELTLASTSPGLTIDQGLTVVFSQVRTLNDNWADIKVTKILDAPAWTTLTGGHTFDKEMQVFTDLEKQTVDPDYDPASGTYFVESLRPIDIWRSERLRTTKTPTARDFDSAIISEIDAPFQFPGILYRAVNGYYVKRARAELCQHILRTWWVSSDVKPTVDFTPIIMDDVIIPELNDVTKLSYSGPVLHDYLVTFGSFIYPATTPSATEYVNGATSGSFTRQNFALLSVNGTGGASVGETIIIGGSPYAMTITVTSVYNVPGGPSGLINGHRDNLGNFPVSGSLYGPFTDIHGNQWNVWSVDLPDYVPGTGWIGNEKIVAANIEPTDIPELWKIETKSVVMR